MKFQGMAADFTLGPRRPARGQGREAKRDSGATQSVDANRLLAQLCEVDGGATKSVGANRFLAQVEF